MRVAGWERALVLAIERHSAMPFEPGVSDCAILPADCVLAITGDDPLRQFRGYTTEAGGAKRIMQAGFADLGALFAAHFPEVPPSLAQRGDIGVIDREGALSGGVFTSFGFASKGSISVVYEPVTAVSRAFKVE